MSKGHGAMGGRYQRSATAANLVQTGVATDTRDVRTILTLLAAAALSLAGWRIWDAVADAGPSGPPLPPHEALQRELIRLNVDQPGDPVLLGLYADLNVRHFQGALPTMPVRWEPRLADVGARATPSFTLQGMYGHTGRRAVILLDPSLQADHAATTRVLSHEMVHAYLDATGAASGGSSEHGPLFQSVLRRLSAAGAFEGVLATDEEREQLRAWLDAESARLEAEREMMTRVAGELEAERTSIEAAIADFNRRTMDPNGGRPSESEAAAIAARRDAYNQRAADFTDRTARSQQDVEHFNREVERYNLMLVYPDGLDVTGLRAPKPVR
jgi:hypothetical protein